MKLYIDPMRDRLLWAIEVKGVVVERGESTTFEEIRILQQNREITDVRIDAGFRVIEVSDAAERFGWVCVRGSQELEAAVHGSPRFREIRDEGKQEALTAEPDSGQDALLSPEVVRDVWSKLCDKITQTNRGAIFDPLSPTERALYDSLTHWLTSRAKIALIVCEPVKSTMPTSPL